MASSRVEFAVATPDMPAWKDSVQDTLDQLPCTSGIGEMPQRPHHLCSVTSDKAELLAGYAGRGRIPR